MFSLDDSVTNAATLAVTAVITSLRTTMITLLGRATTTTTMSTAMIRPTKATVAIAMKGRMVARVGKIMTARAKKLARRKLSVDPP